MQNSIYIFIIIRLCILSNIIVDIKFLYVMYLYLSTTMIIHTIRKRERDMERETRSEGVVEEAGRDRQ